MGGVCFARAQTADPSSLAPPPLPLSLQAETRDLDDVTTALADFAAAPRAKHPTGETISAASVASAHAEAVADAGASPAPSRFGGRALPGMGGPGTPGGFRLPGMGK